MVRRILLPTHRHSVPPHPAPRAPTRNFTTARVPLPRQPPPLCPHPLLPLLPRRVPQTLSPTRPCPNYRCLHGENRAEWDFAKADVATHGLGRAGNALERLDGFDLEAAAFCESLFGAGYARACLPL